MADAGQFQFADFSLLLDQRFGKIAAIPEADCFIFEAVNEQSRGEVWTHKMDGPCAIGIFCAGKNVFGGGVGCWIKGEGASKANEACRLRDVRADGCQIALVQC